MKHALARAAAAALTLFITPALLAAPQGVPGALLRQGNWNQDVGSYGVPEAWSQLPARQWPMDGWATILINDTDATLKLQPLSKVEATQALKPIVDQLEAVAARAGQEPTAQGEVPEGDADGRSPAYVRIPGVVWQARTVPLYRFKNGTPRLTPELGYRFELSLNGRPFAFTLQNGFRTADGRPYGEGTQFYLEMGGQKYHYDLGGYGWDVRIKGIGDLDGDGQPDFIFDVGGSNSGYEALILSSKARPGTNPPTAYLSSWGC